MLSMPPLHLGVMPVSCSSFLQSLFSPRSAPTFIQKFFTKFFTIYSLLKGWTCYWCNIFTL